MKINLISGPRNVSTALMYSFAQRADTQVVDEPFYACYLSQTDIKHPGQKKVLKAQPVNVKTVTDQLLTANSGVPILFIKNMAHHLKNVADNFLEQVKNVFLIRRPSEMIVSFIKKIPNPTLRDTAYQYQYRQFNHMTKVLNHAPIVIDSGELLKHPRAVLQQMCKKLSIDFDDRMLSWPKGPIPEDGVWAEHWYESVHQSTGFKPYKPKAEPVPKRLQSLQETCCKYYQPLYKHAIKAPVD